MSTNGISHTASGSSPPPPVPKFELVDTCHYSKNIPDRKRTEELFCTCKDDDRSCNGTHCVNWLMYTECPKDCPAKKCRNQRFAKRRYMKVEPQYTGPQKGFGLFAKEHIKKSKFIIEYVGEVLPRAEYEERKEMYAKDPNHKHHYLCDTGAYTIDATRKGNVSRFINHSCAPNACCQKWTVPNTRGNVSRIGFFALRDIEPGEEITFDYNFQVYGREAQPCHCGAPNCAKWIGQVQEDEPDEGDEDELETRSHLLDEEEIDARLCEIEPLAWTRKREVRELITMANHSEYSEQRLRILNTLFNDLAVRNVKSLSLICSEGVVEVFTFWLKEPMIHADDVLLNLRILALLNGIELLSRQVKPDCELVYAVTQLSDMAEPTDDLVVQATVQGIVNDVIDQVHKELGTSLDKDDEETPILTGYSRLVEIAKRVLNTWTSRLILYKIPKKVKVEPVVNGVNHTRMPSPRRVKDFDKRYSQDNKWKRCNGYGRGWKRNNYKRHLSYYDARRYDYWDDNDYHQHYSNSTSRSRSPSVERKRRRLDDESKTEGEEIPQSVSVSGKRRSRFDCNMMSPGAENGHLPPPSVITPASIGGGRIFPKGHPMHPMPFPHPAMMPPMPMPGYDMMYWYGGASWPGPFGNCPQPSSTAFLTAEAPPPPPSKEVETETNGAVASENNLKSFRAECGKKTKSELQNLYELLQKKLDIVREAMATLRREEASSKAMKEAERQQESVTAPSSLEDLQTQSTTYIALKPVQQSEVSARSSTPPPVPVKERYIWAKAVDANGDKYYYNKDTRETQWSPPRPDQGELDPAERTPPPPCDTSGCTTDAYRDDIQNGEMTSLNTTNSLSEESLLARAEQIFSECQPRSSQLESEERPPSASSEASSKASRDVKHHSSSSRRPSIDCKSSNHKYSNSANRTFKTADESETYFKSYLEKMMRSEIRRLLESHSDTTREKMDWLGKQLAKEVMKKEKAKAGDSFSYDVAKVHKSKVVTYANSVISRKLSERGEDFWREYRAFSHH